MGKGSKDIKKIGAPLDFTDERSVNAANIHAEIDFIVQMPDRAERELAISAMAERYKGRIRKATVAELVNERLRADQKTIAEEVQQTLTEELKAKPIDATQLIKDLETYFAERSWLPEGGPLVLAYVTLNSYVFDVFDTTPYICLDSAVPRCGKSTTMRLLEYAGAKAINVTAMNEPIFRLIDQEQPMLLVDEAEGLEGHTDRADNLRTILHEGYKNGARVPRCVGEDHKIEFFRIYCPKVFAAIGGVSGALLDRCLVLHMERMPAGVKLKSSRVRTLKRDSKPLVEKLQAYAVQFRGKLQEQYDEEPDETYWPSLPGREGELCGPLLHNASIAGPEAEAHLLQVARTFGQSKAEIQSTDWHISKTIALLEALEGLSASGDTFTPGDVVDTLTESEAWSHSFGKVKGADEKTRRKGMAAKVGYFLRDFRLKGQKGSGGVVRYNLQTAIDTLLRHVPENHPDLPNPPEEKPSQRQATETTTTKDSRDSWDSLQGTHRGTGSASAKLSLTRCPQCGSFAIYRRPDGSVECQTCEAAN